MQFVHYINNKFVYYIRAIGALNLSRVSLSGVEQAFTKHTDTKDEAKGIKAHFRMDGGGLLHLDKVEAVFERPPEEEKPPEEKSAFESETGVDVFIVEFFFLCVCRTEQYDLKFVWIIRRIND